MITVHDSPIEASIKLAQGNPGAATVCALVLKNDPVMGFFTLLDMDDMGLRGPAIWIAYKDFAKLDLPTLVAALRERSDALIETIKREGYPASKGGQS